MSSHPSAIVHADPLTILGQLGKAGELSKILASKAPDVPLQPNDILYIPDNSGRRITVGALEKIAGFGSATASGLLIWRR